jgi:arylsulfatase A-like enzyme
LKVKPNIVLVLLDGARWDRLSRSDGFERLRRDGVLLNNVTTAAPYTIASMNATFSGLYGKDNGVDAYYKMFKLKPSAPFLPEILKTHGYFTACDLLTDVIVSSRGFDIHQAHNEFEDDLTQKHPEFLRNALRQANGKPIFAFLHFSRIHTVTVTGVVRKYEWNDKDFYSRKTENLQNYDKAFDEAVGYAHLIKRTVDELAGNPETLLVFFSDHGTGVGERFGERNYGVFTYEETIRAFYLFLGSKVVKNHVTDHLFATIDILPTILEFCGIADEGLELVGRSLYPYLVGERPDFPGRDYAFSETGGLQGPFPSPNAPNVFCVKTAKYKLVYFQAPNEWKLFDLQQDPEESRDLYGTGLPIEVQLKQKLLNWMTR